MWRCIPQISLNKNVLFGSKGTVLHDREKCVPIEIWHENKTENQTSLALPYVGYSKEEIL
jgi:hypothetical protein